MRTFIVNFLYYTGISILLFRLSLKLYKKNHIRSISYHGTPSDDLDAFEKHICFFSKYYSDVNRSDLTTFFNEKKWTKNKPGLIISFDDGLKNNLLALPILEKYGFTGWFCIVPSFIDCPTQSQPNYAKEHGIGWHFGKYTERNYALTWEDVVYMSNKHEIVNHTMSHHRINQLENQDLLEKEIIKSKIYIEEKIQKKVEVFCWVGGLFDNYSKPAFDCIVEGGYKYSLMTNSIPLKTDSNPFFIDRNCIDTSFSLNYVIFSLSGIVDIFYNRKRQDLSNILMREIETVREPKI